MDTPQDPRDPRRHGSNGSIFENMTEFDEGDAWGPSPSGTPVGSLEAASRLMGGGVPAPYGSSVGGTDENSVVLLVRKMRALKKGLFAERNLRLAEQEKVQSLTNQLKDAEETLREKEAIAIKLFKEKEKLQEQMQQFELMHSSSLDTGEEDPSKSPKKGKRGDKTRGSADPADSRKLVYELRLLQRRCDMLEEKAAAKEHELTDIRTQYTSNLETLQERLGMVEGEKGEKDQKLAILVEERRKIYEMNTSLFNERRRLDKESEYWRKHCEEIEQKQALKDTEIDLLKEKQQEARLTMDQMAMKLLDYKGKLTASQLRVPLQKRYHVKKVNQVIRAPAELVVQTEFLLNIRSLGKHRTVKLTSILDVQPLEDHAKRFVIHYGAKDSDTFESPTRDDVVRVLKEFIKIASHQESLAQRNVVDELSIFMGSLDSPVASRREKEKEKECSDSESGAVCEEQGDAVGVQEEDP